MVINTSNRYARKTRKKRCLYPNCIKNATWGTFYADDHTFCVKHKSNNHFRQRNPKCYHIGCKSIATHTNDDYRYPYRCSLHKITGDDELIKQECFNCKGMYYIPSCEDECNICYKKYIRRIYHKKEYRIYQLLLTHGINVKSHDKKIGNYRPDFVINFVSDKYKNINIVLEVDERCHGLYDKDDETKRMIDIYKVMNNNVLFIRYNPDIYYDKTGVKHGRDKKREKELILFLQVFTRIGEVTSNDKNMALFYKTIEDILTKVNKTLIVYYLFYNRCSTNPFLDNPKIIPF